MLRRGNKIDQQDSSCDLGQLQSVGKVEKLECSAEQIKADQPEHACRTKAEVVKEQQQQQQEQQQRPIYSISRMTQMARVSFANIG